MIICNKNIHCYECICYGSYHTGGLKYCMCGKYKKISHKKFPTKNR